MASPTVVGLARGSLALAALVSIAAAADLFVTDGLHPSTRFAVCLAGAFISGGLAELLSRVAARLGH